MNCLKRDKSFPLPGIQFNRKRQSLYFILPNKKHFSLSKFLLDSLFQWDTAYEMMFFFFKVLKILPPLCTGYIYIYILLYFANSRRLERQINFRLHNSGMNENVCRFSFPKFNDRKWWKYKFCCAILLPVWKKVIRISWWPQFIFSIETAFSSHDSCFDFLPAKLHLVKKCSRY